MQVKYERPGCWGARRHSEYEVVKGEPGAGETGLPFYVLLHASAGEQKEEREMADSKPTVPALEVIAQSRAACACPMVLLVFAEYSHHLVILTVSV